jgi:lactate dehydrogenase-like 2-hydroxyacid dehydrogenase
MLKIVFLDADTVGDIDALNDLKKLGDVTLHPFTEAQDTLERIQNADVVLTNKVVIKKEHIDVCPHLKLICITATGMNNVPVEYAREKGISVKNVVGYAVETVAQHTFATLLGFTNQIAYYDNYVKTGEYSQNKTFTHIKNDFYELSGKRMGIVGLGNIGQAVARIAQGFGMEVVYHSASGKNISNQYTHLSLKELLKTSDVVSINAPLNDFTKDLINYEALKWMKKSAILLNMGRGGIVVEADLAKAIDEKCIKGACIDVYEQEPIPLSHPYLRIEEKDRILLTPHVAWAAREAREKLMETIVTYIQEFTHKP